MPLTGMNHWQLEHYLQFIPLDHSPFLVGRGIDGGLNLALSVVSRHHAELVWQDQQWQVRDLGSRNGTFVNDRPVNQPVALSAGDWLRFASVEVRLVHIGQTANTSGGHHQRTDLLTQLPDKTVSIREKIERSIGHNIRLGSCTAQDLADSLNVERSTMYRHVMSEFGMSPSDLLREKRLEYAALLLREKRLSVQLAADAAGFESAAHFSRAFRKHFGLSPSQYLDRQ